MPTATNVIELTVTEERYPPYDATHGTPDPMVRRVLTIRLPKGTATFEQTDYGHAGRFNGCEPRGIDGGLQPCTDELRRICDSVTALL